MTAAQWEAFTERAAIIEYEVGLNRKAATLAAFTLCFPGDCRTMKEEAAAHPYGEAVLYEYLDGLIKRPRTSEKGPPLNAETKKDSYCGKAPNGPLQGWKTLSLQKRKGIEALAYMTGKGIALIGAYESGAAIASGEAWAPAFTADMKIINALRAGTDSRANGSINRFYFLPQAAGQ